jgi:hypothetical protein
VASAGDEALHQPAMRCLVATVQLQQPLQRGDGPIPLASRSEALDGGEHSVFQFALQAVTLGVEPVVVLRRTAIEVLKQLAWPVGQRLTVGAKGRGLRRCGVAKAAAHRLKALTPAVQVAFG